MFSNIVTLSKAKDDIVVNEPQNPIAIKKEYFGSRFRETDKTEKTPKIKLPIILTMITFDPIIPNKTGNDVILYLIKAPKIAPIVRSANSIAFIFKFKKKLIFLIFRNIFGFPTFNENNSYDY